jgi:hypothetical protein
VTPIGVRLAGLYLHARGLKRVAIQSTDIRNNRRTATVPRKPSNTVFGVVIEVVFL